jgi:hypothetical protein
MCVIIYRPLTLPKGCYCLSAARTNSVPHLRGGAVSTALSKTEIAGCNCGSMSNFSSEKRELPASSAGREIDWSKTLSLHSGLPQENRCCLLWSFVRAVSQRLQPMGKRTKPARHFALHMSANDPKRGIVRTGGNVRFFPLADIRSCTAHVRFRG